MSNDLMKKLEEKINEAIDTIELSRMEITELRERKEELENRYVDWEQRLNVLIEKFEQLEEGASLENKNNLEESSDDSELDETESIKLDSSEEIISDHEENELDENESIELKETDDLISDPEENEIDSAVDSEKIEASHENEENQNDEDEENYSEKFFDEDSSEKVLVDTEQADENVFGPNADSYTEAPESSQHYA
tara:strand:+ start:1626 stop:2213 length:588 start_codon:yes stop_codon:yes gene_type:complete